MSWPFPSLFASLASRYVNVSRIQVLPEARRGGAILDACRQFLASISNALTMAHQVMAQIQAELQPMAAQQAAA